MPIKFDDILSNMEIYGEQVISPVLMDYVEWVLEQAQKKGLHRLYFLARDGHILQQIAKKICNRRELNIECRYLYCSRFALRTAEYHLLSKEEILAMIGENSVECTPRIILERSHITEEQITAIARACNIDDLDKPIRDSERRTLVEQLGMSELFWEFLQQESQNTYANAMAYFEQEELLKGDVVIVDSGWSGSMQRSLGRLLHSEGFVGRLEGFYFGMYLAPQSPGDGVYNTFYFNHQRKLADKAWFNNNLFECMLAAPHGMTLGYEKHNNTMGPLLREKRSPEEIALVVAQETGILRYADDYLSEEGKCVLRTKRLSHCRELLRRCMVHPTRAEVLLLGNYRFCDDTTEGYFLPLARAEKLRVLNTRLLPIRVFRRLSHGRFFAYYPFVWYYGSVVGAPKWLQPLYRWNEFLWECVRLSRR